MSAQPMCRHGHGQCCLGQIRCYAHRPSVSSPPASLLEAPLQCHCCLSLDCRVQPCAMCCHALQLLHSSPELTSNAGVRKASGCVKTEADGNMATQEASKQSSRVRRPAMAGVLQRDGGCAGLAKAPALGGRRRQGECTGFLGAPMPRESALPALHSLCGSAQSEP